MSCIFCVSASRINFYWFLKSRSNLGCRIKTFLLFSGTKFHHSVCKIRFSRKLFFLFLLLCCYLAFYLRKFLYEFVCVRVCNTLVRFYALFNPTPAKRERGICVGGQVVSRPCLFLQEEERTYLRRFFGKSFVANPTMFFILFQQLSGIHPSPGASYEPFQAVIWNAKNKYLKRIKSRCPQFQSANDFP